MIYATELLILSNLLALALGMILGRWSVRARHSAVDPSRFADDRHALEAEGNGRAKR